MLWILLQMKVLQKASLLKNLLLAWQNFLHKSVCLIDWHYRKHFELNILTSKTTSCGVSESSGWSVWVVRITGKEWSKLLKSGLSKIMHPPTVWPKSRVQLQLSYTFTNGIQELLTSWVFNSNPWIHKQDRLSKVCRQSFKKSQDRNIVYDTLILHNGQEPKSAIIINHLKYTKLKNWHACQMFHVSAPTFKAYTNHPAYELI